MAKEEPIVKTTVRLPESLANAVKHKCIDQGLSFQEVVTKALQQYLAQKGGR
jgi:predicted DNA binding CopG/RHH family protein